MKQLVDQKPSDQSDGSDPAGLGSVQGNFNNGDGAARLPGLQGPPGPQVPPPSVM